MPYSQQLTATGGDGPGTYSWTVSSGTPPSGLSLAANGAITGTPNSAGSTSFTVQVASGWQTATRQLSIEVHDPLQITTTSLDDGVTGVPYSAVLSATGGDGSFSWVRTAGTLPANLTLAPDGTLSGTPTTPGSSSFTVRVTAGDGQTDLAVLSIDVFGPLQITTTALATGVTGAAYSQSLAAAGGDGSYVWTLTEGALPASLTLAESGSITGVPGSTGSTTFTVRVASGNQSRTRQFTLDVFAPLLVTTTGLPTGVTGSAYSETLTATGGDGAYAWAVVNGSLPGGLSLVGGTISGAPSAAGSSTFTVRVTSGDGQGATQQLGIDVYDPLSITTASLPNGAPNVGYSQRLGATGGDGTNVWTLAGGTQLPAGLSLAGNGSITGTPTGSTTTFTASVASGDGQSVSRSFTLVINPLLAITTTTLAAGTAGTAYNEALAATGGDGTFAWSSTGTLPTGLSLPGNGVFTGTPTVAATFNFTVTVNAGDGQTAQKALSIKVNPGPPSAARSSLAVDLDTIRANDTDAVTVTVTVRDAYDNVVPGSAVLLSVSGDGNTITQPAVTNGSGVASGSFTTTVAGPKTVSGSAAGVEITETQDILARFSFVSVTAGESHTCGITTPGDAYCWGDNGEGAVGDSTTVPKLLPARVVGALEFDDVGAGVGGQTSCGVTTGGDGYCWGYATAGRLGDGNTYVFPTNSPVPVAVSGGLAFAEISVGQMTSCGVTTSGTAYCWGGNSNGLLGNGTSGGSTSTNVPGPVSGGLSFRTISIYGTSHACGLTTEGAGYCWGRNTAGALGDGTNTDSYVPVAVSGGLTFEALSVGGGFTCGLTTSGDAYCWGGNREAQLGNGVNLEPSSVPLAVAGGLTFKAISAGGLGACGLTTSGAAYCWGSGRRGHLGNGTTGGLSLSPVPVSGGLTFDRIDGGAGYNCAVTPDGDAYCWGANSWGTLGNGTSAGDESADSNVPVKVGGL